RASNEAGDGEWSQPWSFTTVEAPLTVPESPELVSPVNSAVNIAQSPILEWEAETDADTYRVQVSESQDFNSPVSDQDYLTLTTAEISGLEYNTLYYWRVRGSNSAGNGEFSSPWSFTTEAAPVSIPGAPVLQ